MGPMASYAVWKYSSVAEKKALERWWANHVKIVIGQKDIQARKIKGNVASMEDNIITGQGTIPGSMRVGDVDEDKKF